MNRSESKYHNTAIRMQSALIGLLENQNFTDISIMDICKAANVNRSTFYAHYDNTYDLLKETYDALIGNFLNECNFDSSLNIKIDSLNKDDLNFCSPKYLIPYLQYIKSHKRLFKIFAENATNFEITKTDDSIIENIFIPIYAKYGVNDKKLIFYMQKFFLKGLDAIVTEWVKNDCEDDILFICEIITFCIRPLADPRETN